ncbi:hypothetical protein A3726_03635 [Erythrobacter sp. HI0037]|nr:hypothetical protein A3719_13250 [Erythrobacter sp. HI0020]KZY14303.1 hypothetical protein A3727_10045 [Erythrobacter sp. HI0038]KZY27657.1 hypothetical protein A3726_03635 [Erythrobacter sp. HI0037]
MGGCFARRFEPGHDTADALFGAVARFAVHAQIEHEARVMRSETAELGGRHLVLAEEFLDGSDQHRGLPNRLVRQANRSPCS